MVFLKHLNTTVMAAALCWGGPTLAQAPPALPTGLSPAQETTGGADEPALPMGLGEEHLSAQASRGLDRDFVAPFGFSGFIETRLGSRAIGDATQKTASIAETRLQLEREFFTEQATFRLVGDFVYDNVVDGHSLALEEGLGFFDLREANVTTQPYSFLDVKMGRQVLTWGVGDFLFINDLFPKDFRSFFIGRDDEYLKAPSDALRVSAFYHQLAAEFVYTPRFDADRSINGSRLSYFNPSLGRIAGRNAIINAQKPDAWFRDDELAARIYGNVGGFELAVYGYDGFWKTPEGQTPTGQVFHPRLSVLGASLRGPLHDGIFTTEIGHYFSRDDAAGTDPLVRNGESRILVGYEQEIAPELTASAQYYVEILSNYDALKQALPTGAFAPDRVHHVITLRLTKLLLNQNLTLSGFNFWSPNEADGHLRLRASYKLSDTWFVEGGSNIFYGSDDNTFFGQFRDNTNLFVAVRRSF